MRLGRTGLSVSRLGLGTMTFGGQCDGAMSAAILDRAAAGGITVLAHPAITAPIVGATTWAEPRTAGRRPAHRPA